jgi:putative phosphonate metabolism protein
VTEPRYAIYHAPAVDSPWWRFGAGWLGRDERRGAALRQPRWPEWTEDDFHALTAEPRRYGFHATLKAPFRLRANADERVLCERVDQLARAVAPVALGRLEPARINDFIALVPAHPSQAVEDLGRACVTELDDLRAQPTRAETERRRPEQLEPLARQLLESWGYPWVLDLFRFHMTLSGPVDVVTGDLLARHAAGIVADLNALHPPRIDRICVFREDHPGAPFVRIHDAELAG